MNYKCILFFLGINSYFITFFSFINILYSYYFKFLLNINSYLITLIISILLGFIFYKIGKNHYKNTSITDQILFVILSYSFTPVLISIPYFLSIYNFNFLDSYFESISGFTTTGFSIINNIGMIDSPLLLWRSSSQWIGGLIFLMITIGIIGSRQVKIKPSYLIPGGSSNKNFYNNFNSNFIKISLIYILTTIFIIFIYSLFNLRLLDSLNIALTVVSSGGFITSENLSSIFVTDLQILILSLTLLFPIFNFFLFFNIINKQFSIKEHQEDIHLALIIFLLSIFFYFFVIPIEGFAKVLLSITTSISTSGISIYSSNFDLSLFFILLTIVGGSLISTSSGFKYVRFYILLKISYQEIYRLAKPINIFNKSLFNTEYKISDDDSKIAFLVFISFIVSLFILSSILTLDVLNFEEAFKLSILTIMNTVNSSLYGLENLNFSDLQNFTKISLIIFMIFGKVEIIAILFLLKKFILKE